MSKVSFALIGLLVLSAVTLVVVRNRRRVAEPWYYDQLQQVSFELADNEAQQSKETIPTTTPHVVSPLALPKVEPSLEGPENSSVDINPASEPPNTSDLPSPKDMTPTPNEVPHHNLPLPSPLGAADEGPIGSGVAPMESPRDSGGLEASPKPLRLPPPESESSQNTVPFEGPAAPNETSKILAENGPREPAEAAELTRLPPPEDIAANDFPSNDFPSDIAPLGSEPNVNVPQTDVSETDVPSGDFPGAGDLQVADDDGKKSETPKRLPPADGVLSDVVSYAAGAVEVSLPNDWKVFETTNRREVRLVLAKTVPKGSRGLPTDGVWISYHLSQEPSHRRDDEIKEMFAGRFKSATGVKSTSSEVFDLKIDGRKALAQEFEITKNDEKLQGLHMLVATPWGICEIHASTPAEDYEENEATLTKLIESLSFKRPIVPASAANVSTASAKSIHGVWKSLRSRMRIMADGTIEVEADQSGALGVGSYDDDAERDIVKGTYTASGDLLRVVWEDESKLNFRWKRKGLSLLMTDHEGKISHLKLILE